MRLARCLAYLENTVDLTQAIRAALRKLFPTHQWEHTTIAGIPRRTCATCGACEEQDHDAWGPYWSVLHRGQHQAH